MSGPLMIPALLCCTMCVRINGNKLFPVLLYYVNIVANMSKNSFLSRSYAPFEAKSGAKL